jgi:hypothetical protein
MAFGVSSRDDDLARDDPGDQPFVLRIDADLPFDCGQRHHRHMLGQHRRLWRNDFEFQGVGHG